MSMFGPMEERATSQRGTWLPEPQSLFEYSRPHAGGGGGRTWADAPRGLPGPSSRVAPELVRATMHMPSVATARRPVYTQTRFSDQEGGTGVPMDVCEEETPLAGTLVVQPEQTRPREKCKDPCARLKAALAAGPGLL